jgi:Cu/Ag efflux protein CusF
VSTPKLSVSLQITGQEVFSAVEAPAAANEEQRTLRTGSNSTSLNKSTTTVPKVDKPPISQKITLGAGTTTLDLAAIAALAMPSGAMRTVDMTGAKLKTLVLRTEPANNVAGVTIAPGGSNPYPMFGAGNAIVLYPDSQLVLTFRNTEPAAGIPAVAGGAKEIDLSGTTADVIHIEMYFGT